MDCLRCSLYGAPSQRGALDSAPLHHVVMVVVQSVSEIESHKSFASLKTRGQRVKFRVVAT